MSFVDGGYQGEEAQRAAFEASRIAITVDFSSSNR
jgi:hypothetical protein